MMKIVNALVVIITTWASLPAQQSSGQADKHAQCRVCIRHAVKTSVPTAPVEFFVGEARVDVTKDETVVKLAMAQHGSVLIELPANDGPRYILPGDPEMATVDEKALERNKRAIVVRPGNQFLPPVHNARAVNPAATVTAQMRSGLVVTFLFYPVGDLAQNVHRCVLQYNRDEVVARRRAAGLPVNLDGTGQRGEMTEQPTAPISISVEHIEKKNASKPPEDIEPKLASNWILDEPPILSIPEPTITADQLAQSATRQALAEAVKTPKAFTNWTKPIHGLSLSLKPPQESSSDFAIVVVGVRNKSSSQLKISSNSPELLTELVDKSGSAISLETVKVVHLEGSTHSGFIAPGQAVYYAIAYINPALNIHQQVKLLVSHTKAIDQPASIIIAKSDE